ncbi:MAG: aldehyde dehydrogenase family protein [Thiohalophilus sp.]|nr:aldehyde dehydrogenase family protein [Thiohalophilus sp.]MDZ7661572.1 aldehyde dehydrogenase family protein [Thiohalophilus sp.]
MLAHFCALTADNRSPAGNRDVVGPAVAAGCPVIVKPAEDTPLSCFRFVAMLHIETRFPIGEYSK